MTPRVDKTANADRMTVSVKFMMLRLLETYHWFMPAMHGPYTWQPAKSDLPPSMFSYAYALWFQVPEAYIRHRKMDRSKHHQWLGFRPPVARRQELGMVVKARCLHSLQTFKANELHWSKHGNLLWMRHASD